MGMSYHNDGDHKLFSEGSGNHRDNISLSQRCPTTEQNVDSKNSVA